MLDISCAFGMLARCPLPPTRACKSVGGTTGRKLIVIYVYYHIKSRSPPVVTDAAMMLTAKVVPGSASGTQIFSTLFTASFCVRPLGKYTLQNHHHHFFIIIIIIIIIIILIFIFFNTIIVDRSWLARGCSAVGGCPRSRTCPRPRPRSGGPGHAAPAATRASRWPGPSTSASPEKINKQ
jgi:uncharacterized integral membrane protein